MVGSTFCFHGKDEFTSFDKPISSFLLFVCSFLFLHPIIKMSYNFSSQKKKKKKNCEGLTRAGEKVMAARSSTLAWRIPRTGEPGGLQSMASLRVGHD